MPGAVASGSQAVSTVTVEVTEGMAHGLTVVDTVAVDPTDGTDATYVPEASTVPAGFTCAPQTPSDVVCSAGDVEPGVYTFGLAFTMAKSTPGPGTLPDTAVAAALNADAAVTSSQTTVNP